MKLVSIRIKNFRSIENLSFELNPLRDGSFTYGLIGVNEAGKSSILRALAIKEGVVPPTPKDFREKTKDIEILFFYQLNHTDVSSFNDLLDIQTIVPGSSLSIGDILGNSITLKIAFSITNPTFPTREIVYVNKNNDTNTEAAYLKDKLTPIILNTLHRSVLWTTDDKFLISRPVPLEQFAETPEKISIPLKNCFSLAGITNIRESISNIR